MAAPIYFAFTILHKPCAKIVESGYEIILKHVIDSRAFRKFVYVPLGESYYNVANRFKKLMLPRQMNGDPASLPEAQAYMYGLRITGGVALMFASGILLKEYYDDLNAKIAKEQRATYHSLLLEEQLKNFEIQRLSTEKSAQALNLKVENLGMQMNEGIGKIMASIEKVVEEVKEDKKICPICSCK